MSGCALFSLVLLLFVGVACLFCQQQRVSLGPLERRDAGVPASKLRRAFAVLVSTSSGVSNLSIVESRAASASALPARAASELPWRLRPGGRLLS